MPSLPSVQLGAARIPLSVLQVIPLEVAERYWVLPFAVSQDSIRLALVYPEQLKSGFEGAIDHLSESLGREVELFKTDRPSFMRVLAQYRSELAAEEDGGVLPETTSGTATQPPRYTDLAVLSDNLLERIPYEYAKLQRVICVDVVPPATYWFASDLPEHAPELLQEIARRNASTNYHAPWTRDGFDTTVPQNA